jgi:6-phosphogluconolactonase
MLSVLVEKLLPKSWDERRNIVVPGDAKTTLIFCVEHFIALAKKAISNHGSFFTALSGGSTPKAIFESLSSTPYAQMIEWNKVHLFWSDERAVPPEHFESNYHMAMHSGLKAVSIPKEQIHRMHAEEHIEENALAYEEQIATTLQGRPFDLVMLGMGEDGHTASLFPYTAGLNAKDRKVIANYIPEKKTWRMTLTYECINEAHQSVIYVLGASKKLMLAKVLTSAEQFDQYPIQKVGTPTHPALWIADEAAVGGLLEGRIS